MKEKILKNKLENDCNLIKIRKIIKQQQLLTPLKHLEEEFLTRLERLQNSSNQRILIKSYSDNKNQGK